MAYVAILFLLVVVVILGLTFLVEASSGAPALAGRGEATQAQYLAEAAANHALWRLLNEPGFPSNQTFYYMHSLAGGRYGYKVRKPSDTTFAAVATVGVSGRSVARQSYVQYIPSRKVMTAYGRLASLLPKYRRLVGAGFDVPRDTVNINDDKVHWMVLEACPTRDEAIMGALDDADDVNLAVWNGLAWGSQVEVSTEAKKDYQSFDIAYEMASGDALVVFRSGTSSTSKYKAWDGSSWSWTRSGPDSAGLWLLGSWVSVGSGAKIDYIVMEAKPSSNEILVAILDDDSDVILWQWTGSGFSSVKYVLETDVTQNACRGVDIAYERLSRDALVVWARKGSPTCKYRVWNGTALGAEGSLPSFGKEAYIVRAVADPTSDYVFVAATDGDSDLNVAVWNGSAWIDSRELETDVSKKDDLCFDVAWEQGGGQALVAWGSNTSPKSKARYFAWTKGTLLSSGTVQQGPDFVKDVALVRLCPVPGTDKILLPATNGDKDLRYSLWTGSRFAGVPTVVLETEIPYDTQMPFAVAGIGR